MRPSRQGGRTANEEPVRIQYQFLVPIYVLPGMKVLFSKQNFNFLSPRSYTHISVRDLYISRIGLPILLQGNMWTDPGNHRHTNVETGAEASQFPEKEYLKWDFPCSAERMWSNFCCSSSMPRSRKRNSTKVNQPLGLVV
jgi:hypothetical protein